MKNKEKSLKEKIVNIILDILIFIFGIILLIFIYKNVQVKILGNDYASFFGLSTFEVQTGSMKGVIDPGDWIVVKETKDVKLGDIITYKEGKSFITHEVVEAYNGTYVTKGRANNAKDKPISKNQIIGKEVMILHHFGILKKTIFSPIVLLFLVIIAFLVTITWDEEKKKKYIKILNDLKSKINNRKEKTNEKPVENEIKKEAIEKEIKEESLVIEKEIKQEPAIEENPKITEDAKSELSEEDLDKTVFFRMVPVDKMELDNTYLKIAENEMNEPSETKKVSILEDSKEEPVDDDSLIKSNLEMLQNRKKKFEDIIEKTMYIKNQELNEIIDILNANEKYKTNEATIKEQFLKAYIDAKYYNYCGDVNVEYNSRNALSRLTEIIKKFGLNLINTYKGSDNKYNLKVEKFCRIFVVIINLEHSKNLIEDIQAKRELYKSKISSNIKDYSNRCDINISVDRIIKTQKIHSGMIKYCVEKLETSMFELKFNNLTAKKNMYALELNHNISFSKVYSDYIVDKTYSEGVIAEDKIIILISLLLIQIVKDMFSAQFKNKYVLYLPGSIYEKENKLKKVFSKLSDEYVKNSVIILLTEKDLVNNKKMVRKLRKLGYKFAVSLEDCDEVKAKDQASLYIMDYIFLTKKKAKEERLFNSIPSEVKENIIYDDIINKIGSFRGE